MTTATVAAPVAKFMTRPEAEAAVRAAGLSFTEQSGFLKVTAPGGRLYIAATKTVRRVDISGFEVSPTLGKVPHCGVFGAVKQQLVLGETGAEALANLNAVLAILVALPAPAPKAPKAKAPKAPKAAKATKEPAEPESDNARAARIALIKRVAAEKKAAISPASMATAAE